MTDFVVGQRWISNTESELGLGLIIEVNGNRVTLLYLATGEQRVYARQNAPLTRARFQINDVIESADNLKLTVVDVIEKQGLLSYQGKDADGQIQVLDEIELNHHIQFNKPQNRLFTGQMDPASWFSLRYETWRRLQRFHQSEVKGLQGARASLIAHQLFIAHEAANRFQPRIMLADEVGLGKTIEAGLILQHRLINGLSQRVLIMVPDSLLHQWLVEMLRRFNLKFSIFDEERCLVTTESNPFTTEQLVLCSQSFFIRYPQRQLQVLEAEWDLLVVDEAHHLEWSAESASPEYVFVDHLARQIPGLILLTATPEQLGKESHFARLRLLDPDRFYDYAAFLADEAQFEPIAQAAKALLMDAPVSQAQQEQLEQLLHQDQIEKLLVKVNDAANGKETRQELIRLLLDHHGTGRILFRNSRQTVKGFPERQSFGYALQPVADSENIEKNPYFIWLVGYLEQLRAQGDKALLICHRAETVLQLEQTLKLRKGISSAIFHEGMSIVERDRAAAYFADEDSQVPLLICSEIGSEGRNFQFVHHLILFDLPENPDLLQQRIGRLDRIGQKHIISIHIPYVLQSKQHSLYLWYEQGFNAFRHNCEAAAQVAEQLNDTLQSVLTDFDENRLQALISQTQTLNTEIERHMHEGRDQLLELNSCRNDVADQLIAQLKDQDHDPEFWPYMEALFDCYGIDIEDHSEHSYILWPSENLRVSYFPYLQDDGLTVTTDRSKALAREDMLFLTQEHPMVMTAMDMVLSSETGNACISVVRHPSLKGGQFLLELLFVLECSAPAELKVGRFLPHTPVRVLIDQNINDVSEVITHDSLIEVHEQFAAEQIVMFLNSQRDHIGAMIKFAEGQAEKRMQHIMAEAGRNMLAEMSGEIKRLVRLKKINPSIKPEEIEQLKEMTMQLHEVIQDARLKLDAIRFLIAT